MKETNSGVAIPLVRNERNARTENGENGYERGGAYIMVWPPINPYDLIKSFVMATGEVIEKPQRKTSQEQNCGGGLFQGRERAPLSSVEQFKKPQRPVQLTLITKTQSA